MSKIKYRVYYGITAEIDSDGTQQTLDWSDNTGHMNLEETLEKLHELDADFLDGAREEMEKLEGEYEDA